MESKRANNIQRPIPPKKYFTIGEVGELCDVKPHVLRYWEQEFTQLKPVKRRGNRRYYQIQEIELIRKIRWLLYDQGFTIIGARNYLDQDENRISIMPHHTSVSPIMGSNFSHIKHEIKNLVSYLRS